MSYNRAYESITDMGTSRAIMLDNPADIERIAEIAPFVELAELRVDKLGTDQLGKHIEVVSKHLGIILTNRIESEGGSWTGSDADRLEIFKEFLSLVDIVDVEMGSPIAPDVIEAANLAGKKVIASYHNLETTPESEELHQIFLKGTDLGPDMVKIATTTNTPLEMARLIRRSLNVDWRGQILSGMGKLGYDARVALAALNTPLMYVRPAGSDAGVPGQMDHEQAEILTNLLYEPYR